MDFALFGVIGEFQGIIQELRQEGKTELADKLYGLLLDLLLMLKTQSKN